MKRDKTNSVNHNVKLFFIKTIFIIKKIIYLQECKLCNKLSSIPVFYRCIVRDF